MTPKKTAGAKQARGPVAGGIADRKRADEAPQRSHAELEGLLRARTVELRRTVDSLRWEVAHHGRTEETLRESEARYRTLFERTGNPVLVIDTEGNYVGSNQAALAFLGCTRDELLAKNVFDFVPPGKEEQVNHEHVPLWSRGGTAEAEYYVDGKVKTLQLTITAAVWQERQVVFGVGSDVTERKRAEQALRESEERFRRLSEAAFEGIFVHESGKIVDANEAIAAIFGYELSEVLGMNGLDLAAPEYRDLIRQDLASAYEGPFEAIGVRKDGTSFVGEVRTRAMLLDDRTVRVVAVRDVTDRKRAEQALRESEERFRTLSQAALEGILIHERGVVLDANLALATMFGYEPSEVEGRNLLDFVPAEWRDFVREKTLSQHEEHFEATALRRDGTKIALEVRGRPMSYRGRPARVVAIRDISERKKAEAALRKAREELEDKVERRMERGIPYGLTFRELTVLNLVAAGMSDKEIGAQLGISPLTASKHVENILAKMGSTCRTEASVRALREEIVN